MAKEQQFIELFPKYDTDKDGQIDSQQFINLVGQLGVPDLYPGSVSNMIRKLNYNNPDKTTLSLEQAKQYFLSFETACKHDIWKNKYEFYNIAAEIRRQLNENTAESAAPAAPGSTYQKQQPADRPHLVTINVLIGPAKPIYISQVEIEVEKQQKQDIPKPFIKLVLTSKTPQRAKTLQVLFKQNFHAFLNLLGQDISDWNDELQKMFHINSVVNDTTTTFFITTTNEDIIDHIKVFASLFEMSFSYELIAKGHLKFQFDYDFEKFYTESQSSFYDIFTKNCKLSINTKAINAFKALRKFFIKSESGVFSDSPIESIIPLSFLHLEEVDADLEFDNAEINEPYELESKNEIIHLLGEIGCFFSELQQGGIKIYQMIELLDESISIEGIAGEWKVKIFLILKNLNKLFLNLAKKPEEEINTVPAQQFVQETYKQKQECVIQQPYPIETFQYPNPPQIIMDPIVIKLQIQMPCEEDEDSQK